jgi:hypothetical protein
MEVATLDLPEDIENSEDREEFPLQNEVKYATSATKSCTHEEFPEPKDDGALYILPSLEDVKQ